MRLRSTSLLALAAALAMATPSAAQETVSVARGIRVSATGEARAVPDRAFIDFGVETQAATARQAADENARRMEQVLAALVRAGVARADIQTREFSVFPAYEQRPGETGEPRIVGYRVSNTAAVRIDDVPRVGTVIDAALAAGANRGYGLRFGFRDPARVRAEALRDALVRARAEAEVIAAGLGVNLGRVIDASTATEPRFVEMQAMRATADMAANTPIEAGRQAVQAIVNVVFAIN
jgi:uncharacterized protein YggE